MSNVLEVILNLVDNLSGGVDSASSSIDDLQTSVDSVSGSIDSIDTTTISDIESSASTAETSVAEVGTAAESAEAGLSSISSTSLDDAAAGAKDLTQATGEAAENTGLLGSIMASIMGLGIASWLTSAADAAGDFGDRWSRMSLVFSDGGGSMDQFKTDWGGAIDDIKEVTGRGMGTIQEELIQLGTAGITSKDVLVDSFNAINGTSFILNGGKNIEAIESSYNRLVKSQSIGSRQLIQLGIDQQDVLDGTGMTIDELKGKWGSMSAEERATTLNSILNAAGAADANEKWKDSYEHLKEAATLAFGGLTRAIGSLILPFVVPAIELLTDGVEWLSDVFKNLNPTIKTVVGFITFLVGGFTAAYLILAPFIGTIISLGTSIAGIAGGLLSGEIAVTVFGVALSSLLGPIALIIGAIIAAIYIWQTWSKEIIAFKDALVSGDWGSAAGMIVDAFSYIGDGIWDALVYAGQQIYIFFTGLPAMIGNASGTLIDLGTQLTNWIIEGLTSLATSLTEYLNSMLVDSVTSAGTSGETGGKDAGGKTGKGLIEGFMEWVTDNGPKLVNHVIKVFSTLLPLLLKIIALILTIAGTTMYTEAKKAGKKLVDGVVAYVKTLPKRLWTWLASAITKLASFASSAYSKAKTAGSKIVSGVIDKIKSLPSKMLDWGKKALGSFVKGIYDSIPGLKDALDVVRKYLPNSPPKMGPLSHTTTKTWFDWTKSLVNAGMEGLSEFNVDGVNFGTPNSNNVNIIAANSGGASLSGKVELTVVHDFKNVPSNIDEKLLVKAVQTPPMQDALVKSIAKANSNLKMNLGA